MGAWGDDYPGNDLAANQIHTHIQTTKQDIMERLRGYNGTSYEHIVFDNSATGRHLISTVGFLEVFDDIFSARTWISQNHPEDGSMIAAGESLYLIKTGEPILASTNDHGSLSNIDREDHPQYMDTLGEETATGDWELTGEGQLNATTFGSSSTDAMDSAHNSLSWYAAHGANSLWQRHFANSCASLSVILYSTAVHSLTSRTGSNPYILMDASLNRWESFPAAQSASGGNLITRYTGGKSVFSWFGLGALYVASDTMLNRASI